MRRLLGLLLLAVVQTAGAQVPICRTSAGTWQNITLPIFTRNFETQFDVTPGGGAIDAFVGLTQGWAAAQKHLATTVRFTTAGKIQALDASAYKSVSVIPYVAGTAYRIRMVVSLTAHTYSAYVRKASAAEQTLATNYKFRPFTSTYSSLDGLGFKAYVGSTTACYDTTPEPVPPDTTSGTLVAVRLTPPSVSMNTNAIQQFAASDSMSNGSIRSFSGTWEATGGSVSQSGTYTAANSSGNFQVIAREGAKADTSAITLTSPPSPPPITPGAVVIAAGSSIQTAVNNNPAGTTFQVQAGTYIRQSVVPKKGDKFLCDLGAKMDGQNVTQYAFWEGSTAPYPDSVTIRRCEVYNYVPPAQFAAIRMNTYSAVPGARAWVIDSNHVHNNANIGIRAGPFALVKYNNVHDQGTLGVSGVGDKTLANGGIIYEYNEIHHNNPTGAGLGFESGGSKFVLTKGLILRYNYVHDNKGPGLWCDIGNDAFQIYGNRVENNKQEGIAIEISYGGVIHDNIVKRNGLDDSRATSWPWGAGIVIAASGGTGIEIYNNALDSNAQGIALIQQNRGDLFPGEPHGGFIDDSMRVKNINIHNNVIRLETAIPGHIIPGSLGATLGVDDTSWPSRLYSGRNITINNNTYYLDGRPYPFGWADNYRTWTQWRGYGFDGGGVADPIPVTIAAGETWQTKVDANPVNTTFRILAGVHVNQTVVPKNGDQFLGDAGAIMDGSGTTFWAIRTISGCTTTCQTDVVIKGLEIRNYKPSFQYGAILGGDAAPNQSKRWVVENNNIHHNRTGGGIRLGDQMIVRNNNIHHNGQIGVTGIFHDGLLEGNELAYNNGGLVVASTASVGATSFAIQPLAGAAIISGTVLRFFPGTKTATTTATVLTGATTVPVSALAAGLSVNDRGFEYSFGNEAGGNKISQSRHATMRGNFSHHNGGPGLWMDGDNEFSVIENNVVEDNYDAGIFYEISWQAVIRDNTVRRNALVSFDWLYGGGIQISDSKDVEVYGNTVEENARGIVGFQQDRGISPYKGVAWTTENLNVHDNTIRMHNVAVDGSSHGNVTGFSCDIPGPTICPPYFTGTGNNRFENNHYHVGSATNYFTWLNTEKTWTAWNGYGHDTPGGTYEVGP